MRPGRLQRAEEPADRRLFPDPGLAALRFSLPLIWFATAGGMFGYLALLAHAKWFAPEHQVPRYHEVMFLLALGLTGITLGQVLRRVRRMAEDYAARREAGKDAA